MLRIRAWAAGLVSRAIWSAPGGVTSPANTGDPVTRARPSSLRSLTPTTVNLARSSAIAALSQQRGGGEDRRHRLHVPGAAAIGTGEGPAHLFLGRIRLLHLKNTRLSTHC